MIVLKHRVRRDQDCRPQPRPEQLPDLRLQQNPREGKV